MLEVETIIQGGAVGIAAFLCFIVYKRDQLANKRDEGMEKLIGNHLKDETEAKVKLAKVMQRLTDVIDHYFNGKMK